MSKKDSETIRLISNINRQPKEHQLHIRLSEYEYNLLNETVSRINQTKGNIDKYTVSKIIREGILTTCMRKLNTEKS